MSYGHGSNNLELVSYCFNIMPVLDGSGGKGTSGWNSESDVPEYSEPDTYRNREEGKAKNSSKATVSPVVAICRSCCISFRLYDFCSSIFELG